jgi:Lrp/AsnC family transcriptional regulator for asnA, asnC and gidA
MAISVPNRLQISGIGNIMVSEVEYKILDELYTDAHRARKRIANKVGISEPSLSKKIADLQDTKIIKRFTIDIDYEKIGYTTHAITLIKLGAQTRDAFTHKMELIANLDEAIELYTVFGEWDLCVRWMCRDNAHLMEVLSHVLETAGDGSKFETLPLPQVRKRERGVRLATG